MEDQGIPTFIMVLCSSAIVIVGSVLTAILLWVLLTATLAPVK